MLSPSMSSASKSQPSSQQQSQQSRQSQQSQQSQDVGMVNQMAASKNATSNTAMAPITADLLSFFNTPAPNERLKPGQGLPPAFMGQQAQYESSAYGMTREDNEDMLNSAPSAVPITREKMQEALKQQNNMRPLTEGFQGARKNMAVFREFRLFCSSSQAARNRCPVFQASQ